MLLYHVYSQLLIETQSNDISNIWLTRLVDMSRLQIKLTLIASWNLVDISTLKLWPSVDTRLHSSCNIVSNKVSSFRYAKRTLLTDLPFKFYWKIRIFVISTYCRKYYIISTIASHDTSFFNKGPNYHLTKYSYYTISIRK